MNEHHTDLPFHDLQIGDRIRQDVPDIDELADSIRQYGLIQPIVVNQRHELIDGGRRTTALERILSSQTTDDTEPTIVSFIQSGVLTYGVHFIRKETVSVDHLGEQELEANIQRADFTWQEEVLAVDKIHKLKKRSAAKDGDKWGFRETGRILKKSHASVRYCELIATAIKANDPEIIKCDGLTSALKILAQRKLDQANKKKADMILRQVRPSNSDAVSGIDGLSAMLEQAQDETETGSIYTEDDISEEFEYGVEELDNDGMDITVPSVPVDSEAISIPLSTQLSNDDMMKVVRSWEGRVNHIITDPPYGIDMNNLAQQKIERIEDTHDADDNISNFRPWLKTCYDVLPEDGFCIWWCDMVHWEELRQLAESIGFKTSRWALIWIKTHACINQAASYNFTKNYEVALVMRKSEARLVKQQASSWWTGTNEPERKQYAGHPFVKPKGLWQWLAKAVALEGQTIGDPFAGVGSGPCSLIDGGFNILASEVDENHYNQLVTNVSDAYKKKYGEVTFS